MLAMVFNVISLFLIAFADLPDKFHMEVEVLEWFGVEKEPSFADVRSGVGVRRLSRDGDSWCYERNSQFIGKDKKVSRSHVMHIFRGGGEKAVYMSFVTPENSVRLNSGLLIMSWHFLH